MVLCWLQYGHLKSTRHGTVCDGVRSVMTEQIFKRGTDRGPCTCTVDRRPTCQQQHLPLTCILACNSLCGVMTLYHGAERTAERNGPTVLHRFRKTLIPRNANGTDCFLNFYLTRTVCVCVCLCVCVCACACVCVCVRASRLLS